MTVVTSESGAKRGPGKTPKWIWGQCSSAFGGPTILERSQATHGLELEN